MMKGAEDMAWLVGIGVGAVVLVCVGAGLCVLTVAVRRPHT